MVVVERWLFEEVRLQCLFPARYVKVVPTRFKLTIVYAHDMFCWLGFHCHASFELGKIGHIENIVIQARFSELMRDEVGHSAA